jgi:hypothetical protein
MQSGIRQPLLVDKQYILVTTQAGIFQLVLGGRGLHIVGAVAVGAAQDMGVFVILFADLDLAVYAGGIGLEDRVMTFAARLSGGRVIRRFVALPVCGVTIGASRSLRVPLSPQGSMNAAVVLSELLVVTAQAFVVGL